MRTKLRSKITLLFMTCALLIAIPAVAALADNVQNDVVAGGTDTITTGSSTTINYQIKNNSAGGGDFSGCDASDGSPVTVTINKPAAVSASPGSLIFNACDSPKPVQFSSNTPGDYNITVSTSDTHGNYNVNGAAYTLHVTNPPPPTNTAPTLNLPSNPTVEATGPNGAAVSFTATADDEQDGPLTPTCEPASGSTFPLGSTQVDCSVTDSGDLTTSGFFSVTVQDTTAPVIASHGDVTAEATGPDGANVSYTSPETSDVVDGNGTAICTPDSGSKFSLGDTTVTCNATDAAGNQATPTTFKVNVEDTTAPVIASHDPVNATATSANGALVTYTSPETSDAVDGPGIANCTPASSTQFAVGSTTVTCNTTDAAGNQATPTTFKVNVAYAWSNFLQPINVPNPDSTKPFVQSVFKMGSTVPVKFQLTGASSSITDGTFYLKYAYTGTGDNNGEMESVATTTGTTGTQFRYSEGQYIYNWSTKGVVTKPGNYELRVYTDAAGTNLLGTASIELKK
jgi:hypothetical protein